MDLSNANLFGACMGVAFEVRRRHAKLHEFAKQLMGVAHRTLLVASYTNLQKCKCVLEQK